MPNLIGLLGKSNERAILQEGRVGDDGDRPRDPLSGIRWYIPEDTLTPESWAYISGRALDCQQVS